MKIWCISDSHNRHGLLNIYPPGEVDMLIHAGDFGTTKDIPTNIDVVLDSFRWLESLKHIKYKVVIAGNHDTSLYYDRHLIDSFKEITYLCHEVKEIGGLRIFGSPYTPTFGHGWAFNVNRHKLDAYWQEIPEGLDFLITHGPPLGILDHTESGAGSSDEYGSKSVMSCGDKSLLNHVLRAKPKYHVFGHIHPEERCMNHAIVEYEGIKFVNAAVLDLQYNIHNNGWIIDLP